MWYDARMAISEQKRGNNAYITYGYWDGQKNIRIYCGKKGLDSTAKKMQDAKRQHYESKIRRMQDKMRDLL